MNAERFKEYMTAEMLMGPNSLRILEELFDRHPLHLSADDIVLDLGCGKGLTSFAIASETSASVYANDLWISAEENAKRFSAWNIQDRVTPFQGDAGKLHFDEGIFRAMVSVDAYHYFAGTHGYFERKVLPFLQDNADVLIGIPGMKTAYSGQAQALLSPWLGEEAYMFKSPSEWKEIIGNHPRMKTVETWEMACFDRAWHEWFATEHEYAMNDQRYFDTLIKPYTCFVGIHIKLK